MRTLALLLALLLPLLATSPAWGQHPPPPDDEEDDASSSDRERFMDRLRMMRMYALTEALALDEATAAKLFPYLRAGDEAMGKVHDELRSHRKALRQMAKASAWDDKALDQHIDAIGKLEGRMATLGAEQVKGLKGILTAEQRHTFVVTQAHLERELSEALRDRGQSRRSERGERGERPEGGGKAPADAPPPRR